MSIANINKMIDYCIKMPENDEYETGHRYPFYSCELLCSINGLNIERLLITHSEDIDKNNEKDEINKETELEEQKEEEKEEKEDILDDKKETEKNEITPEIKNETTTKDDNKEMAENGNVKENNTDIKDKQNENLNINLEENNKKENEVDKKDNTEENKEKIIEDIEENKTEEKEENKTDEKETNEQSEKDDNDKKQKSDEITDNNEKEMEIEIEEIESKKEQTKEAKLVPNISFIHSIFDHIFSFLDNKSSIENTVLSGYFNKIVNYLIKVKTRIILEYIFLYRTELITKLIININNISISNIISNILNALTETNTPEANEKYLIIVNECINSIYNSENNSENDIKSVELICDLIINHIIYNNKIKLSKIIDANIISKFEQIIVKLSQNYKQNLQKILHVFNLLTKMNKSILSNFLKKITTTENSDDSKNEMLSLINAIDKTSNQYISFTSKKNDFKELVYTSFINNFISYCNSMNNICLIIINNRLGQSQNISEKEDSLITSYSEQKIKKYEISYLVELEYLVSMIDIYVNSYNIFLSDENKVNFINEKIEQIINSNYFRLMFEDYLKYKNNNFLSNIIVDLFKIVFDNIIAPKELMSNILLIDSKNEDNKKDNLITLIINDLVQNTKFIYTNSNNNTNQLLFSSHIAILKYVFSCPNPNISEILNPMEKEKFFYKYFIANIYNLFSKKLYKTDSKDADVDKINSLGVRFGLANTLTQSNTNIEFSLESLNGIIDFNLKLYEKYTKGEEYEYLFEERKQKLEQIKKSSEYLRLSRQLDDELEVEEDEGEDINEVNLPKPIFYNSKLDQKMNANEEKDNITSDSDNNDESENENKIFNDINYWRIDIKDENFEDLLKDL